MDKESKCPICKRTWGNMSECPHSMKDIDDYRAVYENKYLKKHIKTIVHEILDQRERE